MVLTMSVMSLWCKLLCLQCTCLWCQEGQGRRGRKMAMMNALSESQLPEVTLQEPIIITDGGK